MKRREFFAAALAGAAVATLPTRRLRAEGAAPAAAADVDLPAIKLGGGQTVVSKTAVTELRSRLRGSLLTPAQEGYEQARAGWKDSADNDRFRNEVRSRWEKVKPFTAGYYVNLNEDDQRATDDNYGQNLARLAAVKRQYDPGNLFRLNANVRPA